MDEYAWWYHNALMDNTREQEPTLKEWLAVKLEQVDNAGELTLRPEEKSLINKLQ
jgi:hypothetical protein